MALFVASTLSLSIIGMAAIIGLKRYELRTGKVLFASVRPRVSQYVHRGVVFFTRTLPMFIVWGSVRVYRWFRLSTRHLLAVSLLWLEHHLERMLHFLRDSAAPKDATVTPSAFLQEVAEHKKTLARRKSRRIKEE